MAAVLVVPGGGSGANGCFRGPRSPVTCNIRRGGSRDRAEPPIDYLVDGLDGQRLRRTEYRGIVWFGARQAPQSGTIVAVAERGIRTPGPFWLPGDLTYPTAAASAATVSLSVGADVHRQEQKIGRILGRVDRRPERPDWSHPQVAILGAGIGPLSVSYPLVVMAPPDAIVDHT